MVWWACVDSRTKRGYFLFQTKKDFSKLFAESLDKSNTSCFIDISDDDVTLVNNFRLTVSPSPRGPRIVLQVIKTLRVLLNKKKNALFNNININHHNSIASRTRRRYICRTFLVSLPANLESIFHLRSLLKTTGSAKHHRPRPPDCG